MSFGADFLGLLNTSDSKALDAQVFAAGRVKFLEDGEHDVRVTAIDRTKVSDNRVTVHYENADGLEYKDFLFLKDVNRKNGKPELNWKFARTLGMLLPSPEAVGALFAEFAADRPQAMDLLIGLKGRLVLKKIKGYGRAEHVEQGAVKVFVVKNVQTGEVVGSGNTIDEATAAAEAAGFDKAFPKADQYVATHADENVAKFTEALASLQRPVAQKAALAGVKLAG